jgi:hypothetical protein
MSRDMCAIVIPAGEPRALATRLLASSNLFHFQIAPGNTSLWTTPHLIRTNMGMKMCLLWTGYQRSLFPFPIIRQLRLRKWPLYLYTTYSATLTLQLQLFQNEDRNSFHPSRLSSVYCWVSSQRYW